jgi:poly-gamma-glutamate capsule biosynthesis protein CapA/YwtB (metallophosphatase superfamily)
MRRIAAREWIPGAPAGLQALVLREPGKREALGRLWAGGDLGFSGRLREKVETDPEFDPLQEITALATTSDLWFVNLETPLLDPLPAGALFASPARAANLLAKSGIHLVNLANNHIRDFGGAGLDQTLGLLQQRGLSTLGAGSDPTEASGLKVLEVGGIRLGWLGCARTLQPQTGPGAVFWELDEGELEARVQEARTQVDVLAVSLHLGYMYVDYPHPDHRRLCLRLAELGADLVLAHHAHVLQGVEWSPGGAFIAHNLGNLLLDWTEGEVPVKEFEEEQRGGAVLVLDLDRGGICAATALPIRVDDDWIVRWARGETGDRILRHLERISRELAGDFEEAFWRQRAARNTSLTFRSVAQRLRRGDVGWICKALFRVRLHHLTMAARWLGSRLKPGAGSKGVL